MLKILRKKGVMKRLLWVIAVVIIVTFGFFGTASYLDKAGRQTAGKIFGKNVSLEDFQKTYEHTRHQAILQYGDNFFKIQQFLDLQSETWDRLMLLAEAKKRRIKVSNQEVIDFLKSQEFFHRNGKFDNFLYNDILRYVFRTKPRTFEEGMRDALKIQKLYEQQTSLIAVSEQEIMDAYKNANEKVQVDYIPFFAEQYKKDVTLTEKDIRDYYDINKNEFLVPPTINVEFLYLPYPDDVTNDKKNEIAATANLINLELKLTPNLIEVGGKYDLLVQETGYFSKENPNLKLGWSFQLLKTAFDLAKGAISEPIETEQGYYILKIKDKKDTYIPEFSEAKEKAKDIVTMQKAGEIAKAKCQGSLAAIKEKMAAAADTDFVDIAKSFNFTIEQTSLFSRGEYLPGLGIAKEFQQAAFALTETDSVSGVVEIPNGYAILHFQSHTPVDETKYQEERNDYAAALVSEKRTKAFNDFLTKLRVRAKLQNNLPPSNQAQ